MKELNMDKVIRELKRVPGVSININTNSVIIKKDAAIGSKTWGKIDFLINHCGFKLIRTNDVIENKTQDNTEVKWRNKKNKEEQRNSKINSRPKLRDTKVNKVQVKLKRTI